MNQLMWRLSSLAASFSAGIGAERHINSSAT
jgi:hypothetical protein